MSKINTIKLVNFKAIDKFEADFNGCTAIITAGNEKGKTSFLRGITDRIRFTRPDVMVHQGQEAGKGELILDTGERFVWEFDTTGKDKLVYYDKEQIKQTVTVELGKRFFPPLFDIDKFLNSPPKDQVKQLQKIVGLDFTDVDERYDKAYRERTTKNQEAEKFHVKLSKMLEVPKVLPVDLTKLKEKKEAEAKRLREVYEANQKHNEELRKVWNDTKDSILKEVNEFNEAQQKKIDSIKFIEAYKNKIVSLLNEVDGLPELVDITKLNEHIDKLPKPDDFKDAIKLYPPEPEYIPELPDETEHDKIDAEILKASEINVEAKKYSDYREYKQQTEDAKVEAEKADELVKEIEDERKKMIESVNFPKGITIDPRGIMVDGFPLDKNQISTSKLYTSALRIAAMNLGEVKSLHFDASYLDNNNLKEIEQWASEQGLQLLIERPDRDGGEIKYELIEN